MIKYITAGESMPRPYRVFLMIFGLMIALSGVFTSSAQTENAPTPPPVYDRENTEAWMQIATEKAIELVTWADGDRVQIIEAMESWSDPDSEPIGEPKPNGVFYRYDLDQDGALEYLLGMPIPIEQETNGTISCNDFRCPRMLYLLERDDDGFFIAHDFNFDDPVITWVDGGDFFEIGDLTADSLTELVLYTSWCGAHTCGVNLQVGRWDGTTWTAMGSMAQTYTEIRLQNVDLDDAVEFVFRGGHVGSAGAGIQREQTEIYDFNGSEYVLATSIQDEITDPYFLMLDAHAALQRGHYIRSIDTAMQILTFPDEDYEYLIQEKDSFESQNIRAYAAGLAAIAYIQLGEVASAEVVLEPFTSLQGAQVEGVYAVQDFWTVYQQSEDVQAACDAMEARLIELSADLDLSFESLFMIFVGYNTEVIPNEALCPL